MGISDSYTAWCLNEAALYIRGKLAETGTLPAQWESGASDNRSAVSQMLRHRGVIFNDKRRNDRRDTDA